ncbi:MAG TPA: hypothetical protein VFM46_10960, partial [Pseudomonadales bacterium]|nr:hypothetical protein [Pseudomonadales bacterium]
MDNQFVWDDGVFLNQQSDYRNSESLLSVFEKSFSISADYYRPLALLSFVVQYRLDVAETWQLHLINLVIHLANVVLVFGVSFFAFTRNRLAGNSYLFSLVVTSCYAFHPALIEAVSWLSGRFDLMFAFFGLLTLLSDQVFLNNNRVRFVSVFVFS